MCGIAGFTTSNKKKYSSSSVVSKMLDEMGYRGPDQRGVKTYGDVTLGMARLSIIDTSRHQIPYENATSSHAIVYNGEVYNHDSIRKRLAGKHEFKTSSEAETILYNYIENGEKSFDDYNGMYAFALYDSRRKTTYLVRDKTGEKPIYYAYGSDFFAFASEMKCLLQIVKPRFNESALSYKAYEFTVHSETLFRDIYALEPGEYIKIKGCSFTKHEYWKVWNNLIDIKDNEKKVLSSLTELVEDAILLRTKNCVHRFGCFVSGGVDSALISCIARPDFIYHAHYDYEDFDELDYAHLVAKKIKKKLIVIKPTREDFLRTREKVAYHLDTPCTWTSFSLWMLLERAKKDLKVVLSGEGADETFAGYHRYHLLHHDEQIRRLEAMKQYSYLVDKYYGSPVERYSKLINRCENQYDEAVARYLDKSVSFYFDKMRNDIIHSMGLNDFYSTMQVLLQMSDRLCMAFSIENRSPYLDYRLVQYGFSMPSKYKIRNGITKWALKEVAKKFIPKEIVERVDKRGFSAPVNKWFEWDKQGKYNRVAYKTMVFEDWRKVFSIDGESAGKVK